MSLKTRFGAVHCLCLLFFEAMHIHPTQSIQSLRMDVKQPATCANSTDVLIYSEGSGPTNNALDRYPRDRKLCLGFDLKGLEAAQGFESHDKRVKCYFDEWDDNSKDLNCQRDIDTYKDGYCPRTGRPPENWCGTGACCRNTESMYGVNGCHCDPNQWPYNDPNSKYKCNEGGLLGDDDNHGCQPSLKNMLCNCVTPLPGYYSDSQYIMKVCKMCEAGKYTHDCRDKPCSCEHKNPPPFCSSLESCVEEKEEGTCIACEKGKYNDGTTYTTSCSDCAVGFVQPNTGKSSCTKCESGKYANQQDHTCEDCKQCIDNKVNPQCNETISSNVEGECICDKGYYDDFGCKPVPRGFFKDTFGDEKTSTDCKNVKGLHFTTKNKGSTSINDCVCEQNYVHDTKEDKCNACKGDTPYNPINGSGCRACYRYEYWTNNACQNLSRMELSFESSVLKIQDQDKYRPFETPDTITQQSRNKPLPQNSYLDINTHKPESCPKCPLFHELQACGTPHTTPQGQNQGQKKVWVTWKDGNQISRQHLITTPISEDGTSTFDSYDFWKQKNEQNDLQIRREGKCVRCHHCPSGKYQSECIDGDDTTCIDCTTDASQCSNVQGQHFYLFHNLSTYINEQWTGGCNLFPNMAQKDYECRPCETWTRKGDDYFLLLGCGTTSQDTRWDEDKVTDEEKKLSQKTVDNSNPNHYAQYQTRIPYCAPGWYVDTSDDNDKCPLSTDTTSTEPWNPECCKKCGDISSAQKKRGSNFKPCTGATNKDTEEYVDRCENGHYTDMVNGTQTCTRCTTC